MQYKRAVKAGATGIRQSKNNGKYVIALLIPTNKINATSGKFKIIKNKFNKKNQKI
ncbi:hypothetical protein JCM1393_07710 [Clostridium carnis]